MTVDITPISQEERDDPTVSANRAILRRRLHTLLEEAGQAIDVLQTHRDTPQASFTTLPQALAQVRTLQAQMKAQAHLQQEHMKRTVAIARLVVGALDETTDT